MVIHYPKWRIWCSRCLRGVKIKEDPHPQEDYLKDDVPCLIKDYTFSFMFFPQRPSTILYLSHMASNPDMLLVKGENQSPFLFISGGDRLHIPWNYLINLANNLSWDWLYCSLSMHLNLSKGSSLDFEGFLYLW